MPVRRSVFRVEEMRLATPPRSNPLAAKASPANYDERTIATAASTGEVSLTGLRQLKDETDSIFQAINRTKQAIAALQAGGLNGAESGRVRRELDAVVDGAEQSIRQILTATEDIDEAANTLSAVLKQEHNRALAQDIRDQVTRIFEACNFHDLAGQRIGKVLTTLAFVEDRVARMMEIWGGLDAFKDHVALAHAESHQGPPPLLNGPKLEGDAGHASQADIDALFRPR